MNAPYTLIVGAAAAQGHEAAYHRIVRAAPQIIAADGGLALCFAAGRLPDVVVGDMDSVDGGGLASARREGVLVELHPVDKDRSDLDIALARARHTGASSVRFTAAFSGRLDHTLAALGTLLSAADLSGRIEEPFLDGYALDARFSATRTFPADAGRSLSVFALDPSTTVSISGVRFPLEGERIPVLSSLGLSNVALGGDVSVTVHSGSLVLLINP